MVNIPRDHPAFRSLRSQMNGKPAPSPIYRIRRFLGDE
jgi:hypothetical protein